MNTALNLIALIVTLIVTGFPFASAKCERSFRFGTPAGQTHTNSWSVPSNCRNRQINVYFYWLLDKPGDVNEAHRITAGGRAVSYSDGSVKSLNNQFFLWQSQNPLTTSYAVSLTCNAGGYLFSGCDLTFRVNFIECGTCGAGQGRIGCSATADRQCINCPFPQVSNGNQACYTCGIGLVPNAPRSGCFLCPPGSFISNSICSLCPQGQFNRFPGEYSCDTCSSNYQCPPGTTTPFICASGFQRSGTNDCVVCDDGFVCDGSGTEGNRQICPVNHFCKDGSIQACAPNTFCPAGSTAEGPACFGFGTKSFDSGLGVCQCHQDFSGTACDVVTSSLGVVSYTSAAFATDAVAFLESEREGDCPCGTLYNGTDCLADPNVDQTISTLVSAGAKAYELAQFEEALTGFARAVECAFELKRVNPTRPVLEHLNEHLVGIEAFSQFGEPGDDGIKDDLYSTLIATQYILDLTNPNKYGFNVFFQAASTVENMKLLMTPPFQQCGIDKMKARIETGCGSTLEDVDKVLASARCALLDATDLAAITLVPAEVFLIDALFCLRSMSVKVDTKAASTEVLEIATFLDERDGPSVSTAEVLNLASFGPPTFVTDDTRQMIPVPPQPILFFEDNIGAKIDSIRAAATRIGDTQRSSQVIGIIDSRSAELTSLLSSSFDGLATYLTQVNGDIMESFALAAATDSAAVLADLEAIVDLLRVGMNRVENSANKMAEYLNVLNGDRVNALINGWKELVEIQFDIETAQAAIVKAQAALDLIKGVFVGIATIALTVAVGPLAGAVAGTAASLVPLRRRLHELDDDAELKVEEEEEEVELNPLAEELVSQHRDLFGICGVGPKDVVSLVSRLGAKGKALARDILTKMTGLSDDSIKLINNAIGTILIFLEAVDLVVPCAIDNSALGAAGNFRAFLAGYADKKQRGLAATKIVLSTVGSGFTSLEDELAEVVAPLEKCSANETTRRLLDSDPTTDALFLSETEVQDEDGRELFICSALGKAGTKLSTSLARTGSRLASRVADKLVTKATFGKMLGVASGVLDIGLGIKSFIDGQARADELRAQAVTNQELNNGRVEAALRILRASLGQISDAILSIVLRLDLVQLGLPFSEVVNASYSLGEDAFNFQPAIWDSIFHDIMDLLEYEVLLCPQIEGQGLVSQAGGQRRALEARTGEGKIEPGAFRRALGPKADKAKAEADLKKANEQFRRVSERIERQECPRFERTLRQVVDWGKSIHEGMFEVVENYRKFEALLSQKEQRDNQVAAMEEKVKKQEAAAKALLTQFRSTNGDTATRNMLRDNSVILADSQFKLSIIETVEESIKLLQEYCNSHYYINPGNRPKECQTNPLDGVIVGNSDYEQLLLNLADRLSNIKSAVKGDWFDFAYDGFSDYDDEILTVSELVDWDDFVEGGYSQLSFALQGPAGGSYDLDNVSTSVARSGPYFCGFDNVGMTSFGVLFFDAAGNIISSDSQEIGVSVSLSGPFWKTADGSRVGFSLKSYDNVPYQYSRPRTVGGSRFCRTDENPTLYGELCDKSRSFQIDDEGLDSQPLPSPYAKWDVTIVEGKELLRSRGASGLAVIASFKATKNDELLCVAPRTGALRVSAVASTGSPPEANAAESVAGGFAAGAAVVGALVLGVVAYRRRKQTADVDEEGEEMLPKMAQNPMHSGGDEVEPNENSAATLEEYHALLKKKVITRKDFEALKKKILGSV